MNDMPRQLALDYPHRQIGRSLLLHADCFEWLHRVPENSIHAIVTDPSYGVKEYEQEQLEKRENRSGGIWRIPSSFDGHQRAPLPRFTALTEKERQTLHEFFAEWSKLVTHVLCPEAHAFVASNSMSSTSATSESNCIDLSMAASKPPRSSTKQGATTFASPSKSNVPT